MFDYSGGDFGFGGPEEKRPPVPQPRGRGEIPVPSAARRLVALCACRTVVRLRNGV